MEIEIVGPNCDTLHQISYLCSSKCKMIMRSILIIFFLPFFGKCLCIHAIYLIQVSSLFTFYYFFLPIFFIYFTFSSEFNSISTYYYACDEKQLEQRFLQIDFVSKTKLNKKKYSNKFNRV